MPDNSEKNMALVPAAIFANRFFLMRMKDGSGRLAFGEIVDGELTYCSAVRMADHDMQALRVLLIENYPIQVN
jgi:hypothetical protein